ncbi:MAG: hypothetical protein K6G17_01905 [Oscillospiraceae bacterium]|nr:hypothetical protein [Oscillospiraceae bacterium]
MSESYAARLQSFGRVWDRVTAARPKAEPSARPKAEPSAQPKAQPAGPQPKGRGCPRRCCPRNRRF